MKVISNAEAKSLGLKKYFTGKPCKYGHISERHVGDRMCCECREGYYKRNKESISEQRRKYRKQHSDTIAERKRRYYQENKDAISESARKYQQENKESITKQRRKYRRENRDVISERSLRYRQDNKEAISLRKRKYYQENPIQAFVRSSLNRIQDNWKGSREDAEKLLGYTYEQLRQRIEFNFKDGMSWDNRSKWHIDHKKPVSRFIDQGITDPKIINAPSNLQPLWAKDNLTKSAKF